jgi:hypothetical protein
MLIADIAAFWGLATDVAVTVTLPLARAVTFPMEFPIGTTTAIESLELVNVTSWEADCGAPATSAVSRTDSPIRRLAIDGVTVTEIESIVAVVARTPSASTAAQPVRNATATHSRRFCAARVTSTT